MFEEIRLEWQKASLGEKAAVVLVFAGIVFLFFGFLFRYVWFTPELLVTPKIIQNTIPNFTDTQHYAIPAFIEYNVEQGSNSFDTELYNAPFGTRVSQMGQFLFAFAIRDYFTQTGKLLLIFGLFAYAFLGTLGIEKELGSYNKISFGLQEAGKK